MNWIVKLELTYEQLVFSLKEANKQNSQLILDKLERESDILALKEEIQMLNKQLKK